MKDLADMAGCALQKIADWLVWLSQTASPNGFNERELQRVSREVRDIAMRRMGTADEVTNVALFLASDLASNTSGEVLNVSGHMKG